MKKRFRSHGFVLLEAMIATGVFAVGVMALGNCVDNCLKAQKAMEEDTRARRVLENRMAEIEAGSVPVSDKSVEEMKGMFEGMTLRTARVALKKKNEKDQELFGIFSITLDLDWKVDGEEMNRELQFYVYPRQR